MSDFIDHRFHLNSRRLHHLLPLGMVFERGIDGAWSHRDAPLRIVDEIGDITDEQIAHAVNTLGPGHGAMYSAERRRATRATYDPEALCMLADGALVTVREAAEIGGVAATEFDDTVAKFAPGPIARRPLYAPEL